MTRQNLSRPLVAAALAAGMAFLALGAASAHAQPPIVQPGAPGEPSRTISAAEASDLAGIRFTEADVRFMQGMISHHAQALEMTALLDTAGAPSAPTRPATPCGRPPGASSSRRRTRSR